MTPRLTEAQLREILEGASKATPKWSARENGTGIMREFEIIQAGGGVLFRSTSYGNMANDAAHIARLCPSTATAMVEELLALRQAADKLCATASEASSLLAMCEGALRIRGNILAEHAREARRDLADRRQEVREAMCPTLAALARNGGGE